MRERTFAEPHAGRKSFGGETASLLAAREWTRHPASLFHEAGSLVHLVAAHGSKTDLHPGEPGRPSFSFHPRPARGKTCAVKPTRLEAFSDGVLAIIITIMVLELKPPPEHGWAALAQMAPTLFFYTLSFVFVAIYWVNHHHLVHLARHVDGPMLWWNMLLLFWLSLIPFATAYLGESGASSFAVGFYGTIAAAAGMSYYFLRYAIAKQHREDTRLHALHRRMLNKNRLAIGIYVSAVLLAHWRWVALGLIMVPALMYFMPERQAERAVE